MAAPAGDEAYSLLYFAGNGGMFNPVAISTALLLQSCFSFFFIFCRPVTLLIITTTERETLCKILSMLWPWKKKTGWIF